ncbi:MAG: hypothetical protein ABIJ21_03600 [Nanoarchaeota archaeon]
MTDKPDYFINLQNQDAVRKAVLESSKSIIIDLKQYHTLLSVRKNKLDAASILREQLKELTFLLDKLNTAIPDKQIEYEKDLVQESLHEIEKPKPQKTTTRVQPPTQPTPPPEETDMAKLERVLGSIEKKLKTIKD